MTTHRIDDPAYPGLVTVSCANFASVPRDKAASLAKLLGVVRSAARQGCDLVVFPELAIDDWEDCADCARAHRPCAWHLAQAETGPGPSSDAVAKVARELGIHVIYGFEERDPDEPGILYNAAAVVTPDGFLGTYRKLHLGIPLETDRFTPGCALPVFETRLGPIGIQICYDFYCGPELSRLLCLKGARLLVNPTGRSALPRASENLMHATLVRAQENLVYAASANRVGPYGQSSWAGGSVIGGPAFPGFGQVRARAGEGEELVVAPLSFSQLAAWYDWLPWRDWRLGPQRPITALVAREFEALASKPR
ncbi:MAG: carbon-nitrogen hydrolase family protein [Deltaproteobacteria bacterium]|nr:carbon-nitrogen hydrolase family protein [Deltaproteobacteria bacterium]